jgi:lysophospholipase L1-like esterase
MRRKLMLAVATMLATAPIAWAGPAGASDAAFYVSVGDSAAVGEQPTGETANGYADQLYRRIKSTSPELQLVKLGCSGETAASLISGRQSPCDYPAGSQLDEATTFLQDHPGQIAFITINVGVNDVLNNCMVMIVINPVCVYTTMPEVQANLASILRALQTAAPGVPIAGMSYWDPFLGSWTFDPIGKVVARINNRSMQAMNAGLVATYEDEGALVADVAGPAYFDIANFSDRVSTQWGRVPVNVANACRWTWFCAEPPLGLDPHPNTTGYGVIADAFEAVLPV